MFDSFDAFGLIIEVTLRDGSIIYGPCKCVKSLLRVIRWQVLTDFPKPKSCWSKSWLKVVSPIAIYQWTDRRKSRHEHHSYPGHLALEVGKVRTYRFIAPASEEQGVT